MRIFKSKWFAKFAHKERITDAKLCDAARNAERGIIDADYGGGVMKQRIARPNERKSGGYRSIVFFRKGERVFFVYGFAKNAQDNIDESDERDFKALAKTLLGISDMELEKLTSNRLYEEVKFDEEN